MALFLRDLGGIEHHPPSPHYALDCRVKPQRRIHTKDAGEIRQEWMSWWDSIMQRVGRDETVLPTDELQRLEGCGFPILARFANAHYGQATIFAQQYADEFSRCSYSYMPQRLDELEQLLTEAGVEHKESNEDVHLRIIDLPLSEPRAWLAGAATVVASTSLLKDRKAFHGYLEPLVTIIFE